MPNSPTPPGRVVELARPQPHPATRNGVEGTITLDRGVIWRTADTTERLWMDRLAMLSARREGHFAIPLLVGLLPAPFLQAGGHSVAWAVAGLWVAAGLRLAWDRVRPRVAITAAADGEIWEIRTTSTGAFDDVQALRDRLPHGGAEFSIDERIRTERATLFDPRRASSERAASAWTLAWAYVAPVLVWVVLWAGAYWTALENDAPTDETFVILGMGPPIAVLLWPISGLLGLLAQVPVLWLTKVLDRSRS